MTINLRVLLKLLRQNLPVVLVCSLVGMLGLLTLSFLSTPKYTSTVTLFVSTPANALDLSSLSVGSSFAQQRVKSYADIIDSPITLKPVVEKLGLSLTPYKLASMVSADAPLDTVLIKVNVVTTDPILSANVANAVGQQFEITASQLEFGADQTGIKVTVVNDAIPSESPSSPRYLLNTMAGLILGFLMGICIAVIRLYFSGVVKNTDHLLGLPLLAAVGFDVEAKSHPLINSINKYSARAETFRQLRTNVIYLRRESRQNKRIKGFILVITSSLPGEGKTTAALNLGLTLVAAGKKVLYVEGDLRRPSAKNYFQDLKKLSDTGFSKLLQSNVTTPTSYLRMIKRDAKSGLDLMFAGQVPQNAGELIIKDQISNFLNFAKKRYEYVIVDTPPLLPVSDSLSLAGYADAVILVVRAGETRIAQFQGVLNRIQNIGVQPLGCILNMIPEDARDYDDYGYRYEYGKYSYRGYLYRKYAQKYGYEYGNPSKYGYKPNTYPPDESNSLRLKISEE